MSTVETYDVLAGRVLSRPARLGGVRLVAIDGPSGAGKTMFAGGLAETVSRLTTVEIVHTDSLLDGWQEPISVWPRLREWVIDPLERGCDGAYRSYDWMYASFRDEWQAVPVPAVLIVEGVTSACADIRVKLSYSVLVTAEPELRFRRVLERDGVEIEMPLRAWQAAEESYFVTQRTADHVDLVVDGGAAVRHDPDREYVRLR